jgi:hypothetical protein
MSLGYAGGYFFIALPIGIVLFFATGWSWSRGWARKRYGPQRGADAETD